MIFAFFNASVFAILLQNLVFNGGFGMSEAIRIATKPKDFFPIALLVAFFTSATAAVCSALDSLKQINELNKSTRQLIMLRNETMLVLMNGQVSIKQLNNDL